VGSRAGDTNLTSISQISYCHGSPFSDGIVPIIKSSILSLFFSLFRIYLRRTSINSFKAWSMSLPASMLLHSEQAETTTAPDCRRTRKAAPYKCWECGYISDCATHASNPSHHMLDILEPLVPLLLILTPPIHELAPSVVLSYCISPLLDYIFLVVS
jgi:hypothetical protein